MRKLISFPLLVLLAVNFSCQEQELKPDTDLIERTQNEIDQFMLTHGFINYSSSTINSSNGRVTSNDNQDIIEGILTILQNNGGVELTNQDMIANFNSIIEEYEATEGNNSNGRVMCEMSCHISGSIDMGDGISVVVMDCSDGCGWHSVTNYWFEGTTLIGVMRYQ